MRAARCACYSPSCCKGCAFTPPHDTDPIRNEIMISVLAQVGQGIRLRRRWSRYVRLQRLVQYAFALSGVQLPRSTQQQHDIGKKIDFDDARPGDLLFYKFSNWFGVDHVAIYVAMATRARAATGGKVIVTDITGALLAQEFLSRRSTSLIRR